mgnify:CR=1 FL=1
MNRKEYVDWAVKVLTVVRSVWSTFSGEGASEWRESVHKEFIKTGKIYLSVLGNIQPPVALYIDRPYIRQ